MSTPEKVQERLEEKYPGNEDIRLLSTIIMSRPVHSMARHDGMMALESLAGRAYSSVRECECSTSSASKDGTHCILCGGAIKKETTVAQA